VPDAPSSPRELQDFLESCYACYNTREFLHSDPLEIVHEYADPAEREVVALITACLAYGQVTSIKNSVRELLGRLEERPHRFLLEAGEGRIESACRGFRHRFTGAEDMVQLLRGVKRVLEWRGSLESCFCAHCRPDAITLTGALTGFVEDVSGSEEGIPHLLPTPVRGSACKRLWLFLRWMVRRDAVDPGGWDRVSPSGLVVPLDVHMGRICRSLGLTERAQADLRAAKEATAAFRRIRPEDPVRYDFALTRVAMCEGMEAIRNWRRGPD
jgi:uncharacterized protein (TIGR02757 family)